LESFFSFSKVPIMEINAILIISSALFFCGCIGLVTVRLTNPFLKGLGWLGAAFAAGSLGAAFFAAGPDALPGLSVIVPNTLILLAYVFFHVCILELTDSGSLTPKLGIFLLAAQVAAYGVFLSFHNAEQLCLITLGLVVAAQAIQSAALLKKSAREGMRAPTAFSIILLVAFAAYNIFRSAVVIILGAPPNPLTPNPLEVSSAFIFLGIGLGLGFGVFWMASENIRLALEGRANTDPLTGICNRRSFISMCEKELSRTVKTGEQLSVIMFDLDHFKNINDRHGHGVGDKVLCATVEKLRNSVRNIDIVGRWGGEEFVALLPNADSKATLIVAERLRRNIESLSISDFLPGNTAVETAINLAITVSIGVAIYPGSGNTMDELLHQCDSAMYRAKAEGRNRIVATDLQLALQL